jgi:hypothetical protein
VTQPKTPAGVKHEQPAVSAGDSATTSVLGIKPESTSFSITRLPASEIRISTAGTQNAMTSAVLIGAPVLPPLPSPTVSATPAETPRSRWLFREAIHQASVDNSAAITAQGADAIRANQLINQLIAPANAEQLYNALCWCEQNNWPDKASTVTLVKHAIPSNSSNRELVLKLAEIKKFAWPEPFDANTALPNFMNMQTIGMLVLANARYGGAKHEVALRDIKSVILLGRQLQGDNATVAGALNGLELRAHGVLLIASIIQHQPALISKPAELATFLAREQIAGQGAMRRAWEHQARAAEKCMNNTFRLMRQGLTSPVLKQELRYELAQKQLLPVDPINNDELMDFVSTRTLRKYYRRCIELGQEFSRKSPGWRPAHRSEYQFALKKIYRPWARRRDPFPLSPLDELLFEEDRLNAQANLVICALAVLDQAHPKRPLETSSFYLKAIELPPDFAKEPFTGKIYVPKEWRRERISLQGASRRDLLYLGVPDHVIRRQWINQAKPLVFSLRSSS